MSIAAAEEVNTDSAVMDDWLSIVTNVNEAQRRLIASVEASGVPAAAFQVLQLLLRAEGHRMPMSRLARSLSMTGGGFTKLADRLARDGLIDRRHSDTDRRVIRAQLTPAGEQLAAESMARFQASIANNLLPSLSADTVHGLAQALNALGDSITSDYQGSEPAVFDVSKPRDPHLPDRRQTPR